MPLKNYWFEIIASVAILLLPCRADAQSTLFTYQGHLNVGGSAANGRYDLQFSLWSAASGPAQVGSTLTNTATASILRPILWWKKTR